MCFHVKLPKGEYDVRKYIGAEPYDRKKYGSPENPKNHIIRLDADVDYICEVQLNLARMLAAKSNAHKFYEGHTCSKRSQSIYTSYNQRMPLCSLRLSKKKS